MGRHLLDFYFEASLGVLHDFLVLLGGNKTYGKTLGAKSTRSTNSVQVLVTRIRHIVVKNYVDPLDVNTTSQNIGSNHNPRFEGFELFELLDAFFLGHSAVATYCWETVLD